MSSTPVQFGIFLATCILISGCTVCQNARRTMWYEPAAFSWKHDRRRSVEVYRQWAERAWQEESVNCQEMMGASDYVLGFHDGFVDYVYAGGNGEPPVLECDAPLAGRQAASRSMV
jgi:hypothetical protein